MTVSNSATMLDRKMAGFVLIAAATVIGLGLYSIEFYEQLPWMFIPGMVGAVLLYLEYRKWYCEQCGQVLGTGDKPNRCNRCGSNRVTTRDPGAGEAVRVKDGRGRRR